MIVTELSKGIKLFLLVGGKGTRLSSVTNGIPKALVDINGRPFIELILDNLFGFDITLVCSDLNYEYFKHLNVDIFNEGNPSGTGGFLAKVNLPESFYVMNGDTFFSEYLNVDSDCSTIFVTEEEVSHDVGYIKGENGKVKSFVEKNLNASGKELVSLGIYKIFKKDLNIPDKLTISIEYDIISKINLSYKILKTKKFDIGTPERLEEFKKWSLNR